VAGVVLVRQRPGEGKAIFITLEDETGIANILLWARLFEEQRRPVMAARMMEVQGEIQKSSEGVVHLMATRIIDRSHELAFLLAGLPPQHTSSPENFLHSPRPLTASVPRGQHPRDVRIVPRSRDFH
jgi:error-prone DNA polymerase